METIEVVEENGEVKEVQIDSNKQNDPQITFNEVEFPDDEKVKKLAKKQKRNEIISTIILLIIIGGIIFGILYYTGIIKFGTNNQVQTNNIVLSEDDKKYLLEIIDLTENGYPRLDSEKIKSLGLSGDDYIDYSPLIKTTYFIDMEVGEHTLNDMNKNDFESFLAISIKDTNKIRSDGSINHPCQSPTRECLTISKEQYEKFSKTYNINESMSAKLNEYNNNYLVHEFEALLKLYAIKDSVEFSTENTDALITYNIELSSAGINYPPINKSIIFRFKKNDEGNYYLYNFVVSKNE